MACHGLKTKIGLFSMDLRFLSTELAALHCLGNQPAMGTH